MLFGPQRGSAFTIFDRFAGNFGAPLVILMAALVLGDRTAILENGIVLIVVLIVPVSRLLGYFFTYYSIDKEKFHIASGIFNKKELEIPLDRITTVDFTQNLIFRLADVYRIRVDNASNYGGGGSGTVQLALKKADAVRFKELLLSTGSDRMESGGDVLSPEADAIAVETGEDTEASLRASSSYETKATVIPVRKILIMGALQSKGNALAQVISLMTLLGGMVNMASGRENVLEEKLVDFVLAVPGIGIAAMLFAAFIVISVFFGAVFALIRYYGFRITEERDSIRLEYGLFTRKSYSLLKEKISGLEFVQSLPMCFLGIGYLNVLAVGYGDDESEEKSLMYPLASLQEAAALTEHYFSEFAGVGCSIEKPLRRSLRYFFICPRMFFVLALMIAAVVCDITTGFAKISPVSLDWIWYILALLVILAVLSVLKEYRNTSASAGADSVELVTGGFTRIKTTVKTSMIESVSDSGSLFKRRKGISTIKIGILAPMGDSVKSVRNMPMEAFESIRNVIHY